MRTASPVSFATEGYSAMCFRAWRASDDVAERATGSFVMYLSVYSIETCAAMPLLTR